MEPRTDQPAHKPVLVADGDPKNLRVLEVSLRNAGFDVHAVRDGAEADAWLLEHAPALVIADTAVAGVDGFELGRRIKQRAGQTAVAVLLMGEPTVENRIAAVKAGAEDLLSKPVHVKEVIARVGLLLRRRQREQMQAAGADGQSRFAGDLADMSIVDLLQTIEASRRSGVIELSNKQNARAEIYFRQGAVVDAEVGRLSGREAMFRLFSWSEGKYQVEFKSIRRKDTVELQARALVIEGIERLDEWTRLVRDLPPLSTVFEVDYRLLADRLAEIPDEVNGILRLFDGIRSLVQVMDDCGLADRDVLTIVGRLHAEGIIRDVALRRPSEPARGPDLEGWLTEAAGPFRSPMEAARDQSDTPAMDLLPRPPPTPAETASQVEGEGEGDEAPVDSALEGGGAGVAGAALAESDEAPEEASVEALEEQRERFTNRLHIEGAAAPELSEFENFTRDLVGPDNGSGQDAIPEVRANERAMVIPFPALEGDKRETLPPTMISPEIASESGPGRSTEQGLGPLPMPMEMAVAPAEPAAEPPAEPAPRDPNSFSGVSKQWMDAGDELSASEALEEMGLPSRSRGVMMVAATVAVVAGGLLGLQLWRGGKAATEVATEVAKPSAPPAAAAGHAPQPPERNPVAGPRDEHAAAPVPGAAVPAPAAAAPEPAVPAPAPAVAAPAPPAAAPAPSEPARAEARPGAGEARKPPAPPAVPESKPAAPAAPAAKPAPAPVAADFPKLLAECRRAYEKGKMREATAACTVAKDANPDSGDALVLLAHSEFNRNHRKEALAWAEKAIKADPKLADAYVIMGGVQQDSGHSREAKAAYKKYLELAPRGQYAADLRAIVDTL